jgi:5-methylcytosine-specific restriction endonuclease McrA
MRDFAKRFYYSKAWKDARLSYGRKVHWLCERCGSVGKIVHHKIYLSQKNINDPSITLNHDNLELLCQDCHNNEHVIKLPIAKGLTFDENGNLMMI